MFYAFYNPPAFEEPEQETPHGTADNNDSGEEDTNQDVGSEEVADGEDSSEEEEDNGSGDQGDENDCIEASEDDTPIVPVASFQIEVHSRTNKDFA